MYSRHRAGDRYEYHFTTELAEAVECDDILCRELQNHRLVLGAATGRAVEAGAALPRIELSGVIRQPGILVCPFGSKEIRTYPIDRLVEALCLFQKRGRAALTLCGSKSDLPGLLSAREKGLSQGLVNVTVETPGTIVEFARRIAGCQGVLTMESAGAHLAASMDVPAVVIIGGGHYGMFAPWSSSPRQVWLTEKLDCFGCDWNCSKTKPLCIHNVTPQNIAKAMFSVMARQ